MQKYIRIAAVFCIALGGSIQAQEFDGRLGIGFNLNAQRLFGDTRSGSFEYGVSPALVRFNFNNSLFLDSDISYSRLSTQVNGTPFNTKIVNFGVKGGYRLFTKKSLSPYVYLGVGVLNFKLDGHPFYWDGYGSVGTGLEFFVHPAVGFNLSGDFRYTTGDDFDGGSIAHGKDGFFNIAFGVNYYVNPGRPVHPPAVFSAEVEDARTSSPDASLQNGLHRTAAAVEEPARSSLKKLQVEKSRLQSALSAREEELHLLQAKRAVMTAQMEGLRRSRRGVANGVHANGQAKNEVQSKYDSGLLLYATGEFGDAIERFRWLLTQHAEHSDVGNWWYWLGESYFAEGDYISAMSAFENALSKGVPPTKAATTDLMLAMSRWHAGYVELAYTGFRQLLKKEPPQVYESLIHDYLAQIESHLPE